MEEMKEMIQSRGYIRCQRFATLVTADGQHEFTPSEINLLIRMHLGFSKLSQLRYTQALIAFGFMKRLENGNFMVV